MTPHEQPTSGARTLMEAATELAAIMASEQPRPTDMQALLDERVLMTSTGDTIALRNITGEHLQRETDYMHAQFEAMSAEHEYMRSLYDAGDYAGFARAHNADLLGALDRGDFAYLRGYLDVLTEPGRTEALAAVDARDVETLRAWLDSWADGTIAGGAR